MLSSSRTTSFNVDQFEPEQYQLFQFCPKNFNFSKITDPKIFQFHVNSKFSSSSSPNTPDVQRDRSIHSVRVLNRVFFCSVRLSSRKFGLLRKSSKSIYVQYNSHKPVRFKNTKFVRRVLKQRLLS